MFSWGKLTIVNSLLSDIDIRKSNGKSGAAYVIQFLFLAGLPGCCFFGQPVFSFYQNLVTQ